MCVYNENEPYGVDPYQITNDLFTKLKKFRILFEAEGVVQGPDTSIDPTIIDSFNIESTLSIIINGRKDKLNKI